MFRTSEYSAQILWFSVPDTSGRSRMGVLCGVRWLGEWPISLELASALLSGADAQEVVGGVAAKYRHPPRFSQSILGRFALAQLKERAGAACSEMSFSITHSGTQSGQWAIALGFEDESCGVDLEIDADQERSLKIVHKFIHEKERPLVEASGLSPWAIWCAKEALGKAIGTGLRAPLSQYGLSSVQGRCMSFEKFSRHTAYAWDLRRSGTAPLSAPVASAHLAICIPGPVSLELARIGVLPWFSKLRTQAEGPV